MPIRAERLALDIEAIGKCTHAPGAGADRPTFSAAWRGPSVWIEKTALTSTGRYTSVNAPAFHRSRRLASSTRTQAP